MNNGLKKRVAMLETKTGDVIFELRNGAARVLKRSWLFRALREAVDGVPTWQAWTLLNARAASDGSHLHEIAQALAAGPVDTPQQPKEES